MTPLYLDRAWRYQPAASHANAAAFARRQQQRRREAAAQSQPHPADARSNVQPLKTRRTA
jgi:hypothetical protein